MKINIYGAGVAGLCIATELLKDHHDIQIYDRARSLGPDACSWWAGGMLAPYCEGESAENSVVQLGCEAVNWWNRHTDCVKQLGTLVLTMPRDKSELRRFARLTEQHRLLDQDDIARLEPELSDRFEQALFFEDEAQLNPRQALHCLIDQLCLKGCKINYGIDANLDPQIRRADITIDARGLAARDQLNDLRGVKGEMMILHCPHIKINRTIRLLHPRVPIYLVPRGDHTYMLGATMIENNERNRISARSIFELLGALYALHPAFAEAEIVEIGVDARPAYPDNLPRLQWINQRLYANGLYRHGFLLAPALAARTAEAVKNPGVKTEFMYEN